MKKNTSFQIYNSTQQLPEDWDELANGNVFLEKKYLSVLEMSAPKNILCQFIGLFQEDKLVGIAISQYLDLSKVNSFGERDDCLRKKIRNVVFKNFSSKVLIIGNNMLTGQNSYRFSSKIKISKGLSILNNAVTQLKLDLNHKGLKTHLTIFKDFSVAEITNFELEQFKGYYRFSTQPNMIFTIRDNWNSIEDYCSSLHKKYREQFKRAHKKVSEVEKRKLSLIEIKKHNNKINELYLNVAKNAPFNTFYLAENHFEVFKEKLGDLFLFYGYFINNELIGFNTLIKNGEDIDTYFLGYDENHQREKMLYLNMLYDMITYSICKNYNRIIFARTALEIKSSVGAKPDKMLGLIKHSNYFINLFIPIVFGFFEPKIKWKERNPFH